jgi:hypothetical protein
MGNSFCSWKFETGNNGAVWALACRGMIARRSELFFQAASTLRTVQHCATSFATGDSAESRRWAPTEQRNAHMHAHAHRSTLSPAEHEIGRDVTCQLPYPGKSSDGRPDARPLSDTAAEYTVFESGDGCRTMVTERRGDVGAPDTDDCMED